MYYEFSDLYHLSVFREDYRQIPQPKRRGLWGVIQASLNLTSLSQGTAVLSDYVSGECIGTFG